MSIAAYLIGLRYSSGFGFFTRIKPTSCSGLIEMIFAPRALAASKVVIMRG